MIGNGIFVSGTCFSGFQSISSLLHDKKCQSRTQKSNGEDYKENMCRETLRNIRQVISIVKFSLKITYPLLIFEGIYLLCDHLKLIILEIAKMGQKMDNH